MKVFQAVILGLLQGLTEFLPVSSSGHLVIGQKLLGFSQPPVLFDILVHVGTLLAIIFYLRKKILLFYKNCFNLKIIFIGTLPAAIAGVMLNDYLAAIFNSLRGVGFSLLVTAALLFSTAFIRGAKKDFGKLKFKDALIIGCFQAMALLPGISRSGSTIVGGQWQKLTRKTAFLFSFYLAIPAILGALVLQLPDLGHDGQGLAMGFVGLVVAAFSGFLSLKILEKVVLKGKLAYFAIYCFFLGVGVLGVSLF